MADINRELLKALDGPGPQHKVRGQEALEFSEGSDNALHTKIVDHNGNPISTHNVRDTDLKAELESVKAELQSLKEHTFNTQLTGSNAELELRSRNELYYDGSGLTLAPGESLLIGERYDRIETRLPILMISYRAELRDSLENYSAVVSSYNTNGILRETYSESIELEMNTPTARTFFLARGDVKNNYIEIQISNESDEERSISEITVREVLF